MWFMRMPKRYIIKSCCCQSCKIHRTISDFTAMSRAEHESQAYFEVSIHHIMVYGSPDAHNSAHIQKSVCPRSPHRTAVPCQKRLHSVTRQNFCKTNLLLCIMISCHQKNSGIRYRRKQIVNFSQFPEKRLTMKKGHPAIKTNKNPPGIFF